VNAQNVIRGLISLLIVALAVISGLGVLWWQAPPEKLLGYTNGGLVILGALIAASVAGLVVLWRDPAKR